MAKVRSDMSEWSIEWYTPKYIIKIVERALGGRITLDPASCEEANREIKAKRWYGAEDNGLTQSWKSKRLWLNPPFTPALLKEFTDKLVRDLQSKEVKRAAFIMNNNTETRVFQRLVKTCSGCLFLEKRVPFRRKGETKGGGQYVGQVILFWNPVKKPTGGFYFKNPNPVYPAPPPTVRPARAANVAPVQANVEAPPAPVSEPAMRLVDV